MKQSLIHDASRGITAKEQVESSRWISGPKFLWKPEGLWPQPSEDQDLINLPAGDPGVKKMTTHAIHMQEPWNLSESLSSFSDWHRARKTVAPLSALQAKTPAVGNSKKTQPGKTVKRPRESYTPILTVEEINSAEKEIFKAVQAMAFHEDISTLKSLQAKVEGEEISAARQKKTAMRNTCSLHCLDPFLDMDGV